MAIGMEELRVLKSAEQLADEVWQAVQGWAAFPKGTLGTQLVRAVDSIGANIAEAFGRYHYGEKLRFLYFARGSLYESKYWLNRAHARSLIDGETFEAWTGTLSLIARQVNAFARSLRKQQRAPSYGIHEPQTSYETAISWPEDPWPSDLINL